MGTIVNKTIQEATARLKENYEAQKIFDMSLGDCVPNRDAIISIIEGLRTVTFPGFFGSENMAYVSKDNFAGSTLAILYERLFKQVRVALKFDNKELADAEIRAKAEEYTSTFIAKIPDIQAMILKDVDAEFNGDPAAKDRILSPGKQPGLHQPASGFSPSSHPLPLQLPLARQVPLQTLRT